MELETRNQFFIIGAAKTGTSSLFEYLSRHSSIYIPDCKEIQYYSNDSFYERGMPWYLKNFEKASSSQKLGDLSTTYSRYPAIPNVPKRIKQDFPSAKFIYVMRDPVNRSYSHYCHQMREGVKYTFEEALKIDNIFVDCSKYSMQIDQYLDYFDRKQFLFLFFEDFKNNNYEFLNKIQSFLEIKVIDLTADGLVHKNMTGSELYIRKRTIGKLMEINSFKLLSQYTPIFLKNKIKSVIYKTPKAKKIASSFSYPQMTRDTYNALRDMFSVYDQRLKRILNISSLPWDNQPISEGSKSNTSS